MKLVIQIVLCSVIGGLGMKCGNIGTTLLFDLIKCDSLCDTCNSSSGPTSDNCHNVIACEDKVDVFLTSFCASATPTTHTSIVTATQAIISTSTLKVTITSVIPTAVDRSTTRTTTSTSTKNQTPIKALGSLLGVFVIVLTAVIIGWVWTCWTFKRKGKMDISSKHTTVVINTNEEERYFKNPIHEDTSSEENSTSSLTNNEAPQNPNSSTTIYNTIVENEAGGPAYDVLSREISTDRGQGRVVSNLPESENYSRLGLCDDDIERNYQLLDKENLGSKDKI